MKRYVVGYSVAAVLDDLYTFYMVGLRRVFVELNPINRIVETNPFMYLVLQFFKEVTGFALVLSLAVLFYYVFYRYDVRAAVIGSRIICLGGVLARWVPVLWNLWVLGRFLALSST